MPPATKQAPQRQQQTNGRTMAEATADEATRIALEKLLRPVEWTVADSGEQLSISIAAARALFALPTKSGQLPSDREVYLFLQMCKARGLNPYVGDAILTGYDTKDGPKFSLITTVQSLLKRAEKTGRKTGMESGVIVIDKQTGEVQELRGDFYLDDRHTLAGGWCKVYRDDFTQPVYERVKLSVYNQNRSRWNIDPGGMIVKCAEAAAHRSAFPAETGGLYVREEMDGATLSEERRIDSKRAKRSTLNPTPAEAIDGPHIEDESQAEPDPPRDSAQNPPHVSPGRSGWKADEPQSEAEEFEAANPPGELFSKGQPDATEG